MYISHYLQLINSQYKELLSELACIMNYKNLIAVFIVVMVDLKNGISNRIKPFFCNATPPFVMYKYLFHSQYGLLLLQYPNFFKRAFYMTFYKVCFLHA